MDSTASKKIHRQLFNTRDCSAYRPIMYDDKEYTAFDDPESISSTNTPGCLRSCQWPSLTQVAILALSIALLALAGLYTNLRLSLQLPNRINCGRTIDEAQSRGCTFDALSKSWLPSQCSTYGLEEYRAAGVAATNDSDQGFRFYDAKQTSRQLSLFDMSRMASNQEGGREWVTSHREHTTHCAWMMIRLAHAYKFGERRDHTVNLFEHTRHCSLYLLEHALEDPGIDEISTTGNVIFGGC